MMFKTKKRRKLTLFALTIVMSIPFLSGCRILPYYTVIWKDYDGTILEKDRFVKEGIMPSYDGIEPSRSNTAEFKYRFAGWSPEIATVTEDVTYTATYTETIRKYTVRWKNYNGITLETDENVPYGTIPSYDGVTPSRPDDNEFYYTFNGWDPEVIPVEDNATYTAKYTPHSFSENDGFVYGSDGDGGLEVVRYHGNASIVTVPSTHEGLQVRVIGSGAFKDRASITKIVLPSSVTKIKNNAFEGCSLLNDIHLSTSIVFLGEAAFKDCIGLGEIAIAANISELPNQLLLNCKTLQNVYLHDNITSIGMEAFRGCHMLTSITIPTSTNVIREGTFQGCTNLTTVNLHDDIVVFEKNAFISCTRLTTITLPSNLVKIGEFCFSSCVQLEAIFIPKLVVSIGNGAFSGTSKLASIVVEDNNPIYDSRDDSNAIIEKASLKLIVGCKNSVIPTSVTTIARGAFTGATELASIEIPSSVKKIEEFAFALCTSLTSIIIPSSVTTIETSIFIGDSSLTSIFAEATSKPSGWDENWSLGCFATIYWYSETQNNDGYHWRYVNGVPTVWQ